MGSRNEVSAGGVVYRREEDAIEIALAARRTRRGDLAWGLAKGAIEPGETEEQAAVREVLEETGIEVDVESDLGDIRYFYVGGRPRPQARALLPDADDRGDVEDHDTEMEDVRWFPLRSAVKRAAYQGEREVIQRAVERLA